MSLHDHGRESIKASPLFSALDEAAIEDIVRGFPEVDEFRLTVGRRGSLDYLGLEIEDRRAAPERVAEELKRRLGLRVEVTLVPAGSLPRFEGKGRRVRDNRPA